MIPMVDLRTQYHSLKADIDKAVLDALDATQFILGPNVRQLEEEVSQSLAVPHVVSCASGTDALHLALAALGIGPGDEVITTPFTFIATAEAIAYVGATPVFVDIDAKTFNLDLAQVRGAVTPKTKAVIAVHLFGQPADVHGLMEACCKDNLYLIEDCAQSHGATLAGAMTGTFGDAGCFSFYPTKNLGALGDAGAVVTNDEALADRLRHLRNYGSKLKYVNEYSGVNSRLDELQAAMLRIKLRHLDDLTQHKRMLADIYFKRLPNWIPLPVRRDDEFDVFHIFAIRCPQRDALRQYLLENGIKTEIHYPTPPHHQRAMEGVLSGSYPIADILHATELSLPISMGHTVAEIETVCTVLGAADARQFFEEARP